MLSIWAGDNEMLKNPVAVDNQGQRVKGLQAYGLKGTARLENQARLAPLSKFDRRAAIRGLQECHFVMDEHQLCELFRGYFNNKMTLLFLLVQLKNMKPNIRSVESVTTFLSDLYRHMLAGETQERYRLIFKWLMLFFRKLPDVSLGQRDKAKGFIRVIYDVFGLRLKPNI
jgi:hypothetical protein